MSLGLFFSLAAGFIWSVGNAIDKVVVTKIIRNPFVLVYFYIIVSFVLGVGAYPFVPHTVSGADMPYFVGMSVLYILGVILYFWALQKDEPSRVIPLYALVVLFLSIFSAVFLGEVFRFSVYFGIGCLILGTVALTSRGSLLSVFRSRALGIMIVSTISFSGAYVLMKHLLDSYSAWQVYAYERLFVGLIGLIGLPFAFRTIIQGIRGVPKKRLLLVSFFSEFLGECGALLFIIASSVWYVTLVETAVNVQFIFIFLWGIVITKTWPHLYSEEIGRGVVLRKAAAICLILGGIYCIST
ncbi:MAG: DMT family transporter [Patescibacteria group bacterium]|nr:DMT family transporter [Patescibacteria group bacterium]MDD5715269.1 DMT family transporter [Patescibacteria group bacterium]